MRERKYVKFRVDMYDGTKFKIIDMKPERDLIHYVWNRFVVLAGKVDLEGDLYLSKNIPYTIETLAIEFNRGVDEIKLALDLLTELEMIELTEGNIYRVKNFAKHQNIKTKEKVKSKDKDNKEIQVKENLKNAIQYNEDKQSENIITQHKVENVINEEIDNLEMVHKDISKIDDNISSDKISNKSQNTIPILSEVKKIKRANKKNEDICFDITEETDDNEICCFSDFDEDRPLGEGESIVAKWINC